MSSQDADYADSTEAWWKTCRPTDPPNPHHRIGPVFWGDISGFQAEFVDTRFSP
jgi:hypothetical protein